MAVTHHNLAQNQGLAAARAIRGLDIDWASDRSAEVAAELGFVAADLSGMKGTGKDGSITVRDVRNWGKEY